MSGMFQDYSGPSRIMTVQVIIAGKPIPANLFSGKSQGISEEAPTTV